MASCWGSTLYGLYGGGPVTRISSIGLFALGWCVLAVRVPAQLYCIMSLAFFYRMQPFFSCAIIACRRPPISPLPISHSLHQIPFGDNTLLCPPTRVLVKPRDHRATETFSRGSAQLCPALHQCLFLSCPVPSQKNKLTFSAPILASPISLALASL